MGQALPGSSYTFQVLFLDGDQQPMVLLAAPTIQIFTFSSSGVKQVLIASDLMIAVPEDLGRYRYTYTLPGSLNVGDTLYALKEAVDPENPAARLVEEEQVSLVASSQGSGSGLIPRFVKGG